MDLVLPSLLTTKQSISHSRVVNVELMLAILQFSSYCLLICIALLLSDKFGEFTCVEICHIRCLQTGLPCLVLYIIALLLADEFGELAMFSRLSNLPYWPLAMRALLSFYDNYYGIVLPEEFGELASFVRFVESGIYTACLQRGPSCLVICTALLLADEFGEFANLATFVKFAIFAACERSPLVLLCERRDLTILLLYIFSKVYMTHHCNSGV